MVIHYELIDFTSENQGWFKIYNLINRNVSQVEGIYEEVGE